MEQLAIKKRMSRELWLSYFNRALLRAGTITEREYRAMATMIRSRESGL